MASTTKLIADALVTIAGAISGAPSLVVWRKTEVFHPTRKDGTSGVVISGGIDTITGRTFGSSAIHEYAFQIAWFKATTPSVPGDDVNPSYFKLLKSALSVTAIAGTTVWDYEIAAREEWEDQPFSDGVLVSRCGVLYRTAEAP